MKTAVEWLEENINEFNWEQVFKQAKQKEKEQIIDAVDYGCSDWGSSKDAEKYYNQTYNQNK